MMVVQQIAHPLEINLDDGAAYGAFQDCLAAIVFNDICTLLQPIKDSLQEGRQETRDGM